MYRHILVGLDGSDGSKAALERAVPLASAMGAQLLGLAVEEDLPRFAATVGEIEEAREERDRFFEGVLEAARRVALADGIELQTEIRIGNAAKVIIEHAQQVGADLIVLGHTRSVWGNLLGSTADRVVDHARCDILIVR